VIENMVAMDGIEPPTPAFSELLSTIDPVKSPYRNVDPDLRPLTARGIDPPKCRVIAYDHTAQMRTVDARQSAR
jgi:hypothetical protein